MGLGLSGFMCLGFMAFVVGAEPLQFALKPYMKLLWNLTLQDACINRVYTLALKAKVCTI